MERVGEHPFPSARSRSGGSRYELAGAPGRGSDRSCTSRAPKRGHGDVALARGERSPALLPLARRPWQRHRLGRPAGRLRAAGRPGRGGRGRDAPARAAAAGPLPTRVRPRRGVPVLVRRGRLVTARAGRRGGAADLRAPAGRRRPRRRRDARPRRRSQRRRSRSSTRTRSQRRTSSQALCPSRTGRRACSTRTPRALPRSAARSRRATGPSARGRPAAAATPASRTRSCFPRCSPESSRASTKGCRPTRRTESRRSSTAGSDFDCHAVVHAAEDERAECERDAPPRRRGRSRRRPRAARRRRADRAQPRSPASADCRSGRGRRGAGGH